MAITVLSPHSGKPVKIRDQDVGRAVKDEEGRIFYALPRSDGKGHYGAITRAGGEKDEQRALAMEAKIGDQKSYAKEVLVHDARGRRRGSWRGKAVILGFTAVVLGLVYLFTLGPFGDKARWQAAPPANKIPLDAPATP